MNEAERLEASAAMASGQAARWNDVFDHPPADRDLVVARVKRRNDVVYVAGTWMKEYDSVAGYAGFSDMITHWTPLPEEPYD